MARFDPFWGVVCAYRPLLRAGLSLGVVLLVLSLVGLALAPSGTGSEAISYVNVVLTGLLVGVLGGMARVCTRRD